ncbi:CheR family methyltransferase [Mucilaginibacter sp. dw_454]|uniref:CheR family methyltransferase n=1 Tax=Mucilaginibacter sp. dw_454 TaxID=2720079 RepID=UPI001BD6A4FF|nr:CheR family methyltransferase [Mucilaginibacter sp. dw_454]
MAGKKQTTKTSSPSPNLFPVVGIGASAGGLDALKQFLQALPAKTGMAFVFIQHLNPNHVSILPEILERISPIPVQHITDMVHIEPDRLYIVPENKVVTTSDGVLNLEPRIKDHRKNDIIDQFFSSLGLVHQSYAVGIVLSGALSDGTVGLQVIKSYGGLTFAQDIGSATFDGMPSSAIKAGVIDFILPPAKIAQQLVEINKPFQTDAAEKPNEAEKSEEQVFKLILSVLRARRGVDFQHYKSSTLKRRIIRRMALSKTETPSAYLEKLKENKGEQDALYNDMLISVTSFFRDPETFKVVCSEVFPELLRAKLEKHDPLRIWIAGCATGEEAYSMAMCLQEQLGNKAAALKIQIFATDISETAITKARIGKYRQSEIEGLSPTRIQQFFTKLDGSYQVNKSIRDMCVFAHHNLLKDPPFSKIDLLSCRNVMIYLEPVLQTKALTIFHYALNKDGFLWLGKSETTGRHTDIFNTFKAADKLYTRKGPVGRYVDVSAYARDTMFKDLNDDLRKEEEKDIFKVAEEAMLEKLIPPCVLVNEKFDAIQFKGATDHWLSLPKGKPSFNLLKIAREDIIHELQTLLLQAKTTREIANKYTIPYVYNDLQHFVNLQAIPLTPGDDLYFLVVFQPASSTGIQPNIFEASRLGGDDFYDASAMRIEQLERELIQTRANMRMITEEQEAANEKLQSYNEELLSAGEEQQSLNEELETSKEELQSTNEEIIIVNKELIDRNEQLNNARLYTEAIVNTIREPLLIIDQDLRVIRASRSFYIKFKLSEKEVEGRLLYEIADGEWNIPPLKKLLERILPEKTVMEDFKVIHDLPRIGKRILYLNARTINIPGSEQLILLAMEAASENK